MNPRTALPIGWVIVGAAVLASIILAGAAQDWLRFLAWITAALWMATSVVSQRRVWELEDMLADPKVIRPTLYIDLDAGTKSTEVLAQEIADELEYLSPTRNKEKRP